MREAFRDITLAWEWERANGHHVGIAEPEPGIDHAAYKLTGAVLDVLSHADTELAAERDALESAVLMLSRRLERLPQ